MNKSALFYSLGTLSLALGSISYYVILNYWIFGILVLMGIYLIIISDKKTWLKVLTILIVPVISVLLFFIIMFGFSNEAI